MVAHDLMKCKNWVVVGDVTNSSKYAFRILNALKGKKYNVTGVNPKVDVEGVYKSLEEVPYEIDVIDLCIHPSKGIDIAKQAKALNIKYVLIQPGAESEEIFNYCKENDITAVEGCALVELSRI